MTTYPLTYPSIGSVQSSFRLMTVVSDARSVFTGATQTYQHQGQWFEGETTFRPMSHAEVGQVKGFLANLNGKAGTFLYGDPDHLARGNNGTMTTAPATTNWLRNGNATGSTTGVIGSGGALPSTWVLTNAAGLAVEIIGTGTDTNGLPYVRIKISGSPTGTNFALLYEATTKIDALQGQNWTASHYVRLHAGSLTNVTTAITGIQERNISGSGLASTSTSFTPTSTLTRYSVTKAPLTNASTAKITSSLQLTLTVAAAVDLTLDISGVQLEMQSSATPYVRTTGAASASRAAGITVNGASQTGETLNVVGFERLLTNALAAGDYIQLGSGASARLHMVTENAVTNVEGKTALSIRPPLRSSPANGATVTISDCVGVFQLSENISQWDSDFSSIATVTVAFREVLDV